MVLELINVASQYKQPGNDVLASLLGPIGNTIMEIQNAKDNYSRRGDNYNHATTIAEASPALGWVSVTPTPCPHIQDMFEAGQFWSNKVRMQHKNTDGGKAHVAWVVAFEEMLKEMKNYVKNFHTTGLVWNAKGEAVPSNTSIDGGSAGSSSSKPKGKGPPPPPAPKIENLQSSSNPSGSSAKKVDTAGLFSEINQGANITKGLRKVTDDMKTKNRSAEERTSVVKASDVPKKVVPKKKPVYGKTINHDPVFERQGTKWVVEYQKGAELVIGEDEPVNVKQVVYMYKCENTVVQVKGKLNHVTMDSCKKCGVAVEDVLSGCDAVNVNGCKIQIQGSCPSMSIDKCSGMQVILSKDALDCEIISSKSDEMNIMVPGLTTDADWIEMPVPEQFRTTYNPETGTISTHEMEHGG
eukprot:TRINITY_DN1014_c0_g1_i4.p1 TRINITY_DN1014_c0_g1~~TRINITY_DN1014_c0_g1_i4.p1  ORF type:complete len:411 (-),score=152.30 TRINITY_DN1014_c0_g1_i4:69-1301(-)